MDGGGDDPDRSRFPPRLVGKRSGMSGTRTVVVTGASAGIGRAVARAYGARGANVVLLARGEDGLEAAAKDVEAAGGTPLAIPTDVADFAAVDAAASQAVARFGPLDV